MSTSALHLHKRKNHDDHTTSISAGSNVDTAKGRFEVEEVNELITHIRTIYGKNGQKEFKSMNDFDQQVTQKLNLVHCQSTLNSQKNRKGKKLKAKEIYFADDHLKDKIAIKCN